MLVFIMAGVIWGVGVAFGTPCNARWLMIGLLICAAIAVQLVLPDGHTLRQATGGTAAFWLILLGAAAVVWGYSQGLKLLKSRAEPAPEPTKTGSFSDTELNRYARHIVMREIGGPGQKALKNARVLVIGAGGLGAPALQYLAAAGVGTIGVVDDDNVENTNLQRQVIHTDAMIGTPKVFSAADAMTAQNPFVTVKPYHRRLSADIAPELFADYDIILDGTDNFDTRYLANAAAVQTGKPLISGALSQWEGQLAVFDPANNAPCYRCIFPKAPETGLAPSCAEAGVLGPLPGVIGAMMAVEAIKLITGAGEPMRGKMLIYDALYGEIRQITLKRRADCADCADIPS